MDLEYKTRENYQPTRRTVLKAIGAVILGGSLIDCGGQGDSLENKMGGNNSDNSHYANPDAVWQKFISYTKDEEYQKIESLWSGNYQDYQQTMEMWKEVAPKMNQKMGRRWGSRLVEVKDKGDYIEGRVELLSPKGRAFRDRFTVRFKEKGGKYYLFYFKDD